MFTYVGSVAVHDTFDVSEVRKGFGKILELASPELVAMAGKMFEGVFAERLEVVHMSCGRCVIYPDQLR